MPDGILGALIFLLYYRMESDGAAGRGCGACPSPR